MIDEASGLLNSPGGVAGTIGAGIFAAAVFLRKYWLTDKVNAAVAEANVGLITAMSEQIDKANGRADAAEKRADEATKELNTLIREVAELRGQVASLTGQIEALRSQLK